MSKISQDIGYFGSGRAILESVFRCSDCGGQLLMFGCNTPSCENFNEKRLSKEFHQKKEIEKAAD